MRNSESGGIQSSQMVAALTMMAFAATATGCDQDKLNAAKQRAHQCQTGHNATRLRLDTAHQQIKTTNEECESLRRSLKAQTDDATKFRAAAGKAEATVRGLKRDAEDREEKNKALTDKDEAEEAANVVVNETFPMNTDGIIRDALAGFLDLDDVEGNLDDPDSLIDTWTEGLGATGKTRLLAYLVLNRDSLNTLVDDALKVVAKMKPEDKERLRDVVEVLVPYLEGAIDDYPTYKSILGGRHQDKWEGARDKMYREACAKVRATAVAAGNNEYVPCPDADGFEPAHRGCDDHAKHSEYQALPDIEKLPLRRLHALVRIFSSSALEDVKRVIEKVKKAFDIEDNLGDDGADAGVVAPDGGTPQ
jgi:hypothetical protein